MRLLVSFLKKKRANCQIVFPQHFRKKPWSSPCFLSSHSEKNKTIKSFEGKKAIVTSDEQWGRASFSQTIKFTLFKQYNFQQHTASFGIKKLQKTSNFPFFSSSSKFSLDLMKKWKEAILFFPCWNRQNFFFQLKLHYSICLKTKLLLLKASPNVFFNFVKPAKSFFRKKGDFSQGKVLQKGFTQKLPSNFPGRN